MTIIKEILKTPIQKLDKPILFFKRTNKATFRNIKILAAFNGDLGTSIMAQEFSFLKQGS